MSDDKKLPTRAEDFSAWYNDLVLKAELADYSPVRGCMVIRPDGYGIWERMQLALDQMFKATGHRNAYFPLFIPESFLTKEASHVEGFAPELAVVTHGGGSKLEEPLVVRPTSETIIYHMFAKWLQSYRDLPFLYNQWANVVRWEMRTRLFLRTTEFLWQEGHTAHATHDEAEAETRQMLDLTFQTEAGGIEHAWNTSWGVSTRMIGGLVMTHGDDNGLQIPPRLAPIEVVIVPIWKTDEERALVFEMAHRVKAEISGRERGLEGRVTAHVDDRVGIKPGAKYFHWELKGIPIRMEIGPRDVAANQCVLVRRDVKGKVPVSLDGVLATIHAMLDTMQGDMFAAAVARREANSHRGEITYDRFKEIMAGPGGFVYAGWNGDPAVEAQVKEETKATIRCIPDPEFRSAVAPARCMVTGEPAKHEVIWAKAY